MVGSRSPLLFVFLAIPILYLLALVAFPVAYNILMSLQDVTLGNITSFARPFVGLDNYREVLGDPDFRKVLLNSLLFVAANVIAQLGIGLAVALFFSQRFPGVHFCAACCWPPGCCRHWWSERCGSGCSPRSTA